MTRAKRIVGGAAGLIAIAVCHYGWFTIFGPPARFGTGVEDVSPKFATEERVPAATDSAWPGSNSSTDSIPYRERRATGVVGRVLHKDELTPSGYSVLQTYAGKYWSGGQHLYYRRQAAEGWREVRLPRGFVVSNPRLVTQDGHVVAIVERWNSWWPYEANYGRFLLSAIRPELRAEYAVYTLDLERGTLRYMFPGHSLMLSPDRKFAAYMGSENGLSGFHTIRIWKIDNGESKPALSLFEAARW